MTQRLTSRTDFHAASLRGLTYEQLAAMSDWRAAKTVGYALATTTLALGGLTIGAIGLASLPFGTVTFAATSGAIGVGSFAAGWLTAMRMALSIEYARNVDREMGRREAGIQHTHREAGIQHTHREAGMQHARRDAGVSPLRREAAPRHNPFG